MVRVRQQDTIVATAAGIPRVRKLAIAQAGRMVIMRAITREKPKDIPEAMKGYTGGYDEGFDEGVEAGLGHGYSLRDPTYRQALDFLKKDKTDSREYIENTYVCSHFARDVCNNAEEAGLRCASVELRFPEGGHAIIAFDTIDRGLVYFESQSDEKVNPILGKPYYQCVVPKAGYPYEKPSYDDTIQDILVVW
jgi:hypothetical protein